MTVAGEKNPMWDRHRCDGTVAARSVTTAPSPDDKRLFN